MSRRVVGYVRVAPREPEAQRPDLGRQLELIRAAAAARDWDLVETHSDRRSGRTARRPGLRAAITDCESGRADALVVAKLDRLTYSLSDLAQMARSAVEGGYSLVALEEGVDFAEEPGQLLAEVLATAAAWVPLGLGGQARRARAARRSGRPSSTPPELAARIRGMRESGLTLQAICDVLNGEGVPTPRGGAEWRPTSLRAVLRASSEENAAGPASPSVGSGRAAG